MSEKLSSDETEPHRLQQAVILMGSHRDTEHVKKITDVLDTFGVAYEQRVGSAHKTPEHLAGLVDIYLSAQESNEYIFVTVAGLSNALSGHLKGLVYEANPPIMVIAAPPFNEFDIWSSLRMPYGIAVPVYADPRNAALAVVEEFARSNPLLADKYLGFLKELQQEVLEADGRLNSDRGIQLK